MAIDEKVFKELVDQKRKAFDKEKTERYEKFRLEFNPFPKSGTANINLSDIYNQYLEPVDESIHDKVKRYVVDSLFPQNPEDQILTLTVTGDYGSGKTQLLLYIEYLISLASDKAYVVYIDNPGVKLSELIGTIIDKIGEETFRKFIWNKVINKITDKNNDYMTELSQYRTSDSGLFKEKKDDPFHSSNKVNFRNFLEAWTYNFRTKAKEKEFKNLLKQIILDILGNEFNDHIIAENFYSFISNDIGTNKSWESLTSGGGKYIENKYTQLLKAIIKLVEEQGYDQFYILVDEFEDVTQGRLSKSQVDNYLYSLRTLLDKERKWCVVFSMTSLALKELKSISPPLAERVSNRLINLETLTDIHAKRITENYLNLARESKKNNLYPFTEDSIIKLNEHAEGIARLYLQKCYTILERASEELEEGDRISAEFIEKYSE